jgi:hypothetical protein
MYTASLRGDRGAGCPDLVAASVQFSRPPASSFVSACVQFLVAAVTRPLRLDY